MSIAALIPDTAPAPAARAELRAVPRPKRSGLAELHACVRSEDDEVRLIGAELIALASALASRQDIPSLVRTPHEAAAAARLTPTERDRIAERSLSLQAHESAARAFELLGSPALAAR